MDKRIMVAVDGSAPSTRAVKLGAEIAKRYGAKLALLYVVEPMIVPPESDPGLLQRISDDHRAWAEKTLAEIGAGLEKEGLTVERHVLYGAPADEIAAVSETDDVLMVVIGSRGRSAAKRVILGSTSDRLVHHAKKPVLVVR
jgi:nucleotide-binding universal stress UspA family protein